MGIKTNRIVSSGMLRGVSPSCTVLDAVVGLGVLRNTGMSGYVVLSPVTLASDWSRTRRAPRAEISPEAPEANPPNQVDNSNIINRTCQPCDLTKVVEGDGGG